MEKWVIRLIFPVFRNIFWCNCLKNSIIILEVQKFNFRLHVVFVEIPWFFVKCPLASFILINLLVCPIHTEGYHQASNQIISLIQYRNPESLLLQRISPVQFSMIYFPLAVSRFHFSSVTVGKRKMDPLVFFLYTFGGINGNLSEFHHVTRMVSRRIRQFEEL